MIISRGGRQDEAYFSRTIDHRGFPSNSWFGPGGYGVPLPAGNYDFSFKDKNSGKSVWPNYVNLRFQKPPDCTGYATDTMIDVIKPDFDAERCEQLIVDGNPDHLPDALGGMGAWQNQHMSLELVKPGFGGSGAAIKAKGRCRGNHCTLQQPIDSSCFVPWVKYEFTADVRLVDSEMNAILCDETDVFNCAVAWLEMRYPTLGNKDYAIGRISYPVDLQDGWYRMSGQFISDDLAEHPDVVLLKWKYAKKNEDYIVDNVSLRAIKIDPTMRPTANPTITSAPTKTATPTFVHRNLAYRKPTYQSSTAHSMGAELAVDGDISGKTFTHTGGGYNQYWEVDLTALAVITRVKIYQRIDCGKCESEYQRLNKLYIDVLDSMGFTIARKDWDVEDAPSIFEFSFDSVEGQKVRITKKDQGYFSLMEVEVDGKYPIEPPTPSPLSSPSMKPSWISMAPSTLTDKPTFAGPGENIALYCPTFQSTTAHSMGSELAVDGDISGRTFTHTGGGRSNYWEVYFNSTATIKRVKIYQRTDCGKICFHRLNKLSIEIRNSSNDQIVAMKDWDVEDAPSIFEFQFNSVEGHILRIQKKDEGYFSLMEVQVYGKYSTLSPTPLPTLSTIPSNEPPPTLPPTLLPTPLPTLLPTRAGWKSTLLPTLDFSASEPPSESPTKLPTTKTLTSAPTGAPIDLTSAKPTNDPTGSPRDRSFVKKLILKKLQPLQSVNKDLEEAVVNLQAKHVGLEAQICNLQSAIDDLN